MNNQLRKTLEGSPWQALCEIENAREQSAVCSIKRVDKGLLTRVGWHDHATGRENSYELITGVGRVSLPVLDLRDGRPIDKEPVPPLYEFILALPPSVGLKAIFEVNTALPDDLEVIAHLPKDGEPIVEFARWEMMKINNVAEYTRYRSTALPWLKNRSNDEDMAMRNHRIAERLRRLIEEMQDRAIAERAERVWGRGKVKAPAQIVMDELAAQLLA
jgi:hypothetical protein